MPRISTKAHGAADYATGALLLLGPQFAGPRDRRTRIVLGAAGAAALGQALVTDWELGVARRLPVRRHLALDAAAGAALLTSPLVAGLRRRGTASWLPPLVVGAAEVAAAMLTVPKPGDDEGKDPKRDEFPHRALHSYEIPGAPVDEPDQRPGPLETPSGDAPPAWREEGLRPSLAGAPVEAPGPSVPAGGPPGSTTELEERIDRTVPDAQELGVAGRDPVEQLAAQEEAAAAAEAAAIGGPAPDESRDDPAMKPVYEAGGGPEEGFDTARELLIENASHGDGRGNPLRDAFRPEAESDRSSAEFGEADDQTSPNVETPFDPENEDGGTGPRRSAL
jgi:hypothetical protein